ncbi:MAG: VCBS repeat-containing protein, partial [Anaerolineales bacterium]|nr:VCBS repeat-containing protein [Anaerolineales bacterium]
LVWGNAVSPVLAEDTAVGQAQWTFELPGMADAADPVVADVNGDGFLDIVAATHNGHVVVLDRNGNRIWDTDISSHYGLGNNQQRIMTAPVVADLTGDGSVEIIVGTGTSGSSVCYPGSVIVLDKNGRKAPGQWPFMMRDVDIPPAGCPDGVYGTPAVADMDGDGDMEIAVGGFDKGIYVLNHNGTAVSGFPIDSALKFRFPSWGVLDQKLADTIWSSPALADLDGDNDLELIIGTDEGHFGERFGGERLGWYCPYPNLLTDQYCGGALYAVNHDSNLYVWPDDGDPAGPNYPKYHWDHIQSTPAIADLNNDGVLDIVHGMGTFYRNLNPSSPYANRVLAVNGATGKLLPGWNDFPSEAEWGQGKGTGGATPGSPAIGDITGDGKLDVVIPAMDRKVYAWHANGQPVSGFPVETKDYYGLTNEFNVGSTVVLVDYDGDEVMEILILQNTTMVVIDGDGTQLSPNGTFDPDAFNAELEVGKENGTRFIATSPAVADIDNDGKLEAVVATGLVGLETKGHVIVWELPNSTTKAQWPMYKQNAARTSLLNDLPAIPVVGPDNVFVLHEISDPSHALFSVQIENVGQTDMAWQMSNLPTAVTPTTTQGTVSPNQEDVISLSINPAGIGGGTTNLGTLRVTARDTNTDEVVGTFDIPVTIKRVENLWRNYLPVVTR